MRLFLVSLLLGVLLLPPLSARASLEDLDLDEPMYTESDGLRDPNQDAYNYFMNAAAKATAQSALTPPAQAQKRPGFFSRLLGRAKKKVSLPIEQVEKIPQQPPEPPKTTPVARYAILRLPVMISFNDATLPAGIYAVQAVVNPMTKQQALAIQLQNRTLMEVPAYVSNVGSSPPIGVPVVASANSSKPSKSSKASKSLPVASEAVKNEDTLELQFVDQGQRAILVYQQSFGHRELQSLPLDVLTY